MEKETNSKQSTNSQGNTSSKAMDSKRDVENSNDQKIDQDFRGYPPKEDIMDQRSDSHRVDVDVEKLTSNNNSGINQRFIASQDRERAKEAMIPGPATDDDLGLKPGTEADVTDDDLAVLNSTDGEIGTPQNISTEDLNTDLDIPGSELDDANEEIGEEDEENNYYSLGGDRHERQEEDPNSGPNRED
ncbi:MAG TPA: hypothetical protein VNA26_00465 [Chitinophagaceae bacterium]|nr:hypothetical protein [Chitinophagaceae bacterium]